MHVVACGGLEVRQKAPEAFCVAFGLRWAATCLECRQLAAFGVFAVGRFYCICVSPSLYNASGRPFREIRNKCI